MSVLDIAHSNTASPLKFIKKFSSLRTHCYFSSGLPFVALEEESGEVSFLYVAVAIGGDSVQLIVLHVNEFCRESPFVCVVLQSTKLTLYWKAYVPDGPVLFLFYGSDQSA